MSRAQRDKTATCESWTTSDRRWFKRHPGREFRLRRAFPREIDGMRCALPDAAKAVEAADLPGIRVLVIVWQVEPSALVRGLVGCIGNNPLPKTDDGIRPLVEMVNVWGERMEEGRGRLAAVNGHVIDRQTAWSGRRACDPHHRRRN